MAWILIVLGFLLMVIGGYLKYLQFQPEYSNHPSAGENLGDEYIKRTNKFKQINNELDLLIKSIDNKEKMITEKLNSIANLENTVKEHYRGSDKQDMENSLYQVNEDNDFKKILDRKYQEKEGQKNSSEDSIIGEFDNKINSKYNNVFTLARRGLTAESIAEKLDIGIRETKLLLKLYTKEEDSIV